MGYDPDWERKMWEERSRDFAKFVLFVTVASVLIVFLVLFVEGGGLP